MKICIAGYGNMGKIIAKTLLEDKDNNVIIFDPYEKAREQAEADGFQNILGLDQYYKESESMDEGRLVPCIENIKSEKGKPTRLGKVQILFLCMKPQDIPSFFEAYISTLLHEENPDSNNILVNDRKVLFTSIAAGASLASLNYYFELALQTYGEPFSPQEIFKKIPRKISFIRVMPNLASSVGDGSGAVTYPKHLPADEKNFIENLLKKLGVFLPLDEKHMDAVTAISGSAPAFLLVALDAMADSGVKMGLSRENALTLSAATLRGTGNLVLKGEEHPMVLKDKVASPSGTTIEGLHALASSNFRQGIESAIIASYKRSHHLNRTAERELKRSQELKVPLAETDPHEISPKRVSELAHQIARQRKINI